MLDILTNSAGDRPQPVQQTNTTREDIKTLPGKIYHNKSIHDKQIVLSIF